MDGEQDVWDEWPPALGERAALAGYVPQYEVAAGLLLRALTAETLEWLALLDPEAGRLDDFQLAVPGQLDAFQIKWSQAGGQLAWGALRDYFVDLVTDRRRLAAIHPDRRVVGHLYSDQVASSAAISSAPEPYRNASAASAVAELLRPATEGAFASVAELPPRWRWLWHDLADACNLSEESLLTDFRQIGIDLGRSLPSQAEVPGRDAIAYQRDLNDLMLALLRVATDPRRLVRLTTEELLARLGSGWQQRMELRSVHEFPRPVAYQAVRPVTERLAEALDRFTTGYVALVGSPGSGKSTLLSQELRGRDDVVARYYAYVRGRADIGSTRAEASAFLHDLVLTLERGGLPRGPTPVDFDVAALSARLQRQLRQLGERFQREGRRAIILVDGLDHVERERGIEQPLLRYLPRPQDLPDGVLMVVGSQTLRMLDADIRGQLEQTGRTVQMAGLERAAVAELAGAWAVAADPDRLWRISGGHPLVLTYLLQELRGLPADQQHARLAATPDYGGDVGALYLRLWASVENDDDLVELLALACRMRGAIDLAWLREHGQSPAVIRRLRERLAYLFRREPDRWYFFHESFRLFLQDRTARAGGQYDQAEDRRLHRQLAEMSRATPADQPQSWESLFHLAAADEHAMVLQTATPGFFRAQTLALRPAELVTADIRMAARSLAEVQDPMALVRLVLAAGELQQRSYHLPDRETFLAVLVRTGQWRIAVEHMAVERESHGVEDSRTARLKTSLLLHDAGYHEDALRVFEANEPLELLDTRARANTARGPYQLLYAWARAAAVLKGSDAVTAAAGTLQMPTETWGPERDEDPSPTARAWILAVAADELDRRGRAADADRLLAGLDPDRPTDRVPLVRALSWRWDRRADRAVHLVGQVTTRLPPEYLEAEERVVVAEGLWMAGRPDAAREWLDGVPQPPTSQPTYVRDLWQAEQPRYRLNRLLAALGQRSDPESVVPATAGVTSMYIARPTVAVAQVHGRAWAGEQLTASELMATARRILQTVDLADASNWSTSHKAGQVRPYLLAQLLHVAGLHGREPLQTLWGEYERRWHDKPERLYREARRVLPIALRTGLIPRAAVLQWLRKLEELVQAAPKDEVTPDALTELADTVVEAGLTDDARRLLAQAVAATLVAYGRRYQVGGLIDLLGPQLDGEHGADLVRWLAGTLVELDKRADSGVAGHAARRLLLADGACRPGHAWQVGAWLEEHDVVGRDDRTAVLLQAQIDAVTDLLWWIVLIEQLVPISANPDTGFLIPAGRRAAALHGVRWLQQRLRDLLDHVAVQAPPAARDAWRYAVADCAAACGIAMAEVGLSEELHPDRRPRAPSHGTGAELRDAFLAAHDTVESLLAGAALADLSEPDLESPWSEAVDRVTGRMALAEVEQAATVFASARDRLIIRMRLARRALDLGASDLASRLAEEVLAEAEPLSWRRMADGGPLLGALCLLAELDPEGTRRRAYRRFAADTSANVYLLPELAEDLDQYVGLFGIDDQAAALGREIEQHLRVLLDDPNEQPAATVSSADADALTTLARTGLDLLASPYRLAVTTAQQALLAVLRAGDGRVLPWIVGALQGTDEELILRVLSVVEAALETGAQLGDGLVEAVRRWTTAEHLGIRLASRRVAERLGQLLDPAPPRALPVAYRIVVPEPHEPVGLRGGEPLGRDTLDVIAIKGEGELRRLAEASDVDLGAVNARVANLARRLAGDEPVDERRWQTSTSPLGWLFHRPSIILWEQAVARVAAELADAGRLPAERALMLSIGPGYDPTLIATRPVACPDAVPTLPASQGAWTKPEDWLAGLHDAYERLARSLPGGWTVVGEHTELRRIDDKMPGERRTQNLGVLDQLQPEDNADSRRHLRIADLDLMPASAGATPLIHHWDPSYRGPSTWLTLHPRLALACGWQRDPTVTIGWQDDDGPVVRALWWRTGWLYPARWPDGQDVGEGWLVLLQERALPRLAERLGGEPGLAWQVERDFLARDQSSDRRSGTRGLPS